MAAFPVVYHNSPSAGSIRWDAFTIQYKGASFAIPALSTSNRWVWWKYNTGGGTTQLLTGADLPTDLTGDDLVLLLNKSGIAIRILISELIEGDLIVDGSILADAIGANQVIAVKIATDALETRHFKANQITSVALASGSVTTEQLTVGAVANTSVMNGGFEDGFMGWAVGETNGTINLVTGVVGSSGLNAVSITRNAGAGNVQLTQKAEEIFPVSAVTGRSWYFSLRAGAASVLASGLVFRVHWFQADKITAASTAYQDVYSGGVAASMTQYEGQLTPPSNAKYARVSVYNTLASTTFYVDEIMANEVVTSIMIGNGQVKAAQIDADAINGKTITGATVQTATGTGARVVFGTGGMIAYNASNIATTTISSATGAITATSATISGAITATSGVISGPMQVTGRIYVGAAQTTGARVIITPNGIVGFSSSSTTDATGIMTTISAADGRITASNVDLTGKITATDGAITGDLQVSGSLFVGASATTGARLRLMSSGLIAYDGAGAPVTSIDGATGAFVSSSATITGQINASSGSITGVLDMGGSGKIRTAASGTRLEIDTSGVKTFAAGAVKIDPVFLGTLTTYWHTLKKSTGEIFSVSISFPTTGTVAYQIYKNTDYSSPPSLRSGLGSVLSREINALAIASDGHLLATTAAYPSLTDRKIQKFNSSTGEEITTGGFPVTLPASGPSYSSMRVDSAGNIYIVKPAGNGVLKYSSAGVAAASPWVSSVSTITSGWYIDDFKVSGTHLIAAQGRYIEKYLVSTGARVTSGGFPLDLWSVIGNDFDASCIDFDTAGNLYVIGKLPSQDCKVYKLTSAGVVVSTDGWPMAAENGGTPSLLSYDDARATVAYKLDDGRPLIQRISSSGAQTTDISTTLGTARLSNLTVEGGIKARSIETPSEDETLFIEAESIYTTAVATDDKHLVTKGYVDGKPFIARRNSANQTLSNVTGTTVIFQTAETRVLSYEPANPVSYGVDHYFTVNEPGLWQITANITFDALGTGPRQAIILGGSGSVLAAIGLSGLGVSAYVDAPVSVTRYFTLGERFRITAYQDAGGTLNILGTRCWVTILKVGETPVY